jgi:hypothetical protein
MTATTLPAPDLSAADMRPVLFNSQHVGDASVTVVWRRHGTPDGAAFFAALPAIASREDYIAFRDALKARITAAAAQQKIYARLFRRPGGDGHAQSLHRTQAELITEAIAIRRAGKVWSAAQAQARRAAAA